MLSSPAVGWVDKGDAVRYKPHVSAVKHLALSPGPPPFILSP